MVSDYNCLPLASKGGKGKIAKVLDILGINGMQEKEMRRTGKSKELYLQRLTCALDARDVHNLGLWLGFSEEFLRKLDDK